MYLLLRRAKENGYINLDLLILETKISTTNTYTWSPELVEIYDEAFERCGLEPEKLTARHLRSARRSLEFMFSEWANIGVLHWAVDQVTVTLTQGTATYATPIGTTAILDMILRRGSPALDVNIFPMQRDEYLAIPSKTQQGFPSRYYFNRTMTTASVPVVSGGYGPTITLWSTPENSTDQMIYYRLRQLQDVGAATNTPDIPFRWHEALASGLGARLAVKFAPDRIGPMKGEAKSQLEKAMKEDRQRAPTTLRLKFGNMR